jgi:uncharacterized hydrophobic protein (TIGR00271 family)
MVHLRIVAPGEVAEQALTLLTDAPTVFNVVRLPSAAQKPAGDLILCDVARAEASVVVEQLRDLRLADIGSIALSEADMDISTTAERAEDATDDAPFGDAVVWEEVEERTCEETELSINFLEFLLIAALIAAIGILLDSPILIVGAMVVAPEFGPIAGFCVAVVEGRADLARRSALALAVGFPLAVVVTAVATLVFRVAGIGPESLTGPHPLTSFISNPDAFSFLIAYLAGTAGVLSLTSTKSGALIGVLISVTTIPSIANIGVAVAYRNWDECRGATLQLLVNLAGIFLGGIARLSVQRVIWVRRRRRHGTPNATAPPAARPHR